jgi:hypothetical protein
MMGFSLFSKKRKEAGIPNDMDIPPPPPPDQSEFFGQPDNIPSPASDLDIPPAPEPIPMQEDKLPGGELPEFEDFKIPSLDLPEEPEAAPQIRAPRIRELPSIESFPAAEVESQEFRTGKTSLSQPVYVHVDQYKSILTNLASVRKKLSDSEELLQKLHEVREKESEDFGKWHDELEDIQRKIVHIDKTLFEQ